METANFYLTKAKQCRRLAATITTRDEPAIAALLALAREFDAKAVHATHRETEP